MCFIQASSVQDSAAARRKWRGVLNPSFAPLTQSMLPSIFQDVVRPADGVWRYDFRECLSLSHGKPLQGRWRANNPRARVGRLQSYRQSLAVDSCCGAPSTGHPCEIWQWWLLSVSAKFILDYLDIRMSHSCFTSSFCWVLTQDCQYCAKITMVICDGVYLHKKNYVFLITFFSVL